MKNTLYPTPVCVCVCVYLCVATDAAASRANCLMTLSSKYFCSHLVMSASKAKILSSFSRRCSIRVAVLYSGPEGFCELPDLCFRTSRGNKLRFDQSRRLESIDLCTSYSRFHHLCLVRWLSNILLESTRKVKWFFVPQLTSHALNHLWIDFNSIYHSVLFSGLVCRVGFSRKI